MMFDEPSEPYTKCHECGEWDTHAPTCIAGLRAAYIDGPMETSEFESRLSDLLGAA